MEANTTEHYSLKDIINVVKSFLFYLKRRWWVLLIISFAGAALGAVYYKMQKPKYEGICSFILEDKQSSIGGLNSIASQFGFDVGGLTGGGSFFAGDNILDILKSQKVVKQVLLSFVDSGTTKQTLADLYLQFTGKKKSWKNNAVLQEINFGATNHLSLIHDSVLNTIYESIVKNNLSADRTNKKGTIIRVDVNSADETFSRLMSQRLVEEASKLYLDIKTGTSSANIERMQKRADSLLILLNNKSYSAAVSQPLDINPGLKTGFVPTEIAMRDKSVVAALYTEVIKNLEASKLLLSQETPVIQILDTPGLLLDPHKKSLPYLIAVGFLISMAVAVFYFGFVFLFSKL